jgi:hypothetical protein
VGGEAVRHADGGRGHEGTARLEGWEGLGRHTRRPWVQGGLLCRRQLPAQWLLLRLWQDERGDQRQASCAHAMAGRRAAGAAAATGGSAAAGCRSCRRRRRWCLPATTAGGSSSLRLAPLFFFTPSPYGVAPLDLRRFTSRFSSSASSSTAAAAAAIT